MSIVNQHFPEGYRGMPSLEIHDESGAEKPAAILLLEATHWTACGSGDSKYKFWEHPDRPMEQFTFNEALTIARDENRRACIAGEKQGRK